MTTSDALPGTSGSPERLGPGEIRTYQLHLIETRVSWSRFNQAVCSLRFLYRTTLKREWVLPQIPFPKQEKHLPTVLSPHEVRALLDAVPNRKHRVLLMTIYAAGQGAQGPPGDALPGAARGVAPLLAMVPSRPLDHHDGRG